MRLFDSHCQLDDKSYKRDFGQVLERFKKVGGQALLIAGIDLRRSKLAVDLARNNSEIYASVGVHPHYARDCSEEVLEKLKLLAAEQKVCAWGETGLDFNRNYSSRDDQEHWFVRQLETADELGLPVIFHERDSGGRMIEILQEKPDPNRQGVIHCFSGNKAELEQYLAMGFYIGITGILTITQRGEQLRSLVKEIPLDRLLIETDAPFLTPAPEKNKTRRNEPAFVKSTLLKLAEVVDVDAEYIAEKVWDNSCTLFGV